MNVRFQTFTNYRRDILYYEYDHFNQIIKDNSGKLNKLYIRKIPHTLHF